MTPAAPEPTQRPIAPLSDIVMALRFFSRLPTGPMAHETPRMDAIARGLPVAALLMGLLPAAILLVGDALGLPGLFTATLAVAAMVIVGGGMMEDAIADAADGLFGGWTAERRLDILKDSRHGTYGVAALCLFLVLRIAALSSMPALDAALIWLAANIAGRSAGLWLATALPNARSDGAAASAGALNRRDFWIGAAQAGLIALALAIFATASAWPLLMLVALAAIVLGWAQVCQRLVGGQTGDLIGAAGALAEIGALTMLLIFA